MRKYELMNQLLYIWVLKTRARKLEESCSAPVLNIERLNKKEKKIREHLSYYM